MMKLPCQLPASVPSMIGTFIYFRVPVGFAPIHRLYLMQNSIILSQVLE